MNNESTLQEKFDNLIDNVRPDEAGNKYTAIRIDTLWDFIESEIQKARELSGPFNLLIAEEEIRKQTLSEVIGVLDWMRENEHIFHAEIEGRVPLLTINEIYQKTLSDAKERIMKLV